MLYDRFVPRPGCPAGIEDSRVTQRRLTTMAHQLGASSLQKQISFFKSQLLESA